jgi:pimeloyl-ACP methyl ester carboxylesterase
VNLGNAIRRFLDAKSNSEEGIFRDLNQLVKLRLRAGEMKTESAELLLRRGTEEIGSGYRLRRDPRLNLPSFLRLTERQVLEFLKRIESEVFLIWADNGYQWEKKVIKNRIDSVAKIREVSLPGKHHLHMDQPGEVSQKILEFLGSLKSSGENQSI